MKLLKKISVVSGVMLLALFIQTGCNKPPGESSSNSGDEIKIGEYASLQGKEATFGNSSHEGTVLQSSKSMQRAACLVGRLIC